MKRFLSLTIVCILLLLSACERNVQKININENTTKSAGVWLSFYEVREILASNTGITNKINEISANCKSLGISDIYLHIRSHCDAIYPSKIFPQTKEASALNFDALKTLIDGFHNKGLKVHGWINPYRIKTDSNDINTLAEGSPAKQWLTDQIPENDKNVCITDGIYLNPAELEAQKLVINGIKEVIENYDIDGIHFDDYFYPTTDESFDKSSYDSYRQTTENPLSLYDWRRTNVNSLIIGCYNAIKAIDKEIVFSISPAASIENNFNNLYADAEYWIENGIIDVIIPQLYFGFEYPDKNFQFENLLNDWISIVKANTDVKLQIGLGVYKANTETKADKAEWTQNFDIIAKQVEICHKNKNVTGYVYYSYSSLFSDQEPFVSQRENVLKILEKFKSTTEV